MAWECDFCGADENQECAASCAEARLSERVSELEAENEKLREALEKACKLMDARDDDEAFSVMKEALGKV